MSAPVYVAPDVTLYRGDSLAVLRELPAASVDAVVTDPPYSSGGMVRADRVTDVHTKYVKSTSVSGMALDPFTGDSRDQRGYGYWCSLWLGECLRVVRPGGIIAVFTDWRQLPTTTDFLQAAGVIWRGILPWHKPNGRMTQGRPANNCEYVVWGTNGARALEGPGYETLPGFLQANSVRDRTHIAQKPIEVLRAVVRVAPRGGVVLDPFAGTGTTGVAAIIEGRGFVGVEITEHYAGQAEANLRKALMQQPVDVAAACLPLDV